jgi:hypothetical protein
MEGSETLFCSLNSYSQAPTQTFASPGLTILLFKLLRCSVCMSPYLSTECPNKLEVTTLIITAPFAVERTLSIQLHTCYV